jgi:hypothetical protein
MKRDWSVKLIGLSLLVLLVVPGCHKGPKIRPDVKNVTVNITAPRTRVFQETSIALVGRGFVIITANDSLGLLTTEFKKVEEGFRQTLVQGIFGNKQHPEVQFITNITEKNGISTLTLTAKGRIIYKKRFYIDYMFTDEFMNVVRQLGEEIKASAEAK